MSESTEGQQAWTLIQDDAGLRRVLESVSGASEIAVDTEFMRRNTFFPQVALLQLCAGDEAFLIDPLKVKELDGLRTLLVDPTVSKILHSCSEDLEVFRHWLGVIPAPLIDTQRAMAILGEAFGIGYRALVEQLLGVELEKGETRSDWLRRPLSESQCHYAAQDVLQLWRAWPLLRERAEAAGRMGWLREEGEEITRLMIDRETDAYRRIKGAGKLGRRELAALRNLAEWRDTQARKLDKPRGWLLDDKACIGIAQRLPGNVEELAALDLIPRSVLKKQSRILLDCVSNACELPEQNLPASLPGALTAEQRGKVKTLRLTVKNIAQASGIAPEILASGADLELLLRQSAGQGITPPARWQGWRESIVIEPLRLELE
ncbi:MAG: ribonuclease D [Congregibacter sp.]